MKVGQIHEVKVISAYETSQLWQPVVCNLGTQ